ncbi:MAG: zinc ribbon domain-containing protein [Ruminococcaceae bacterium]|nr:zinc ribbon domain-containing protein [Oscillospiraceae bacterium]
MVCNRCGTPLKTTDVYCTRCGADVRGKVPAKKTKKEYVIVKKSPGVIIVAVLLLMIAAVGIWYSTTDQARIVGRWKCERVISEADAETEETVSVWLNFDLFGNVTEEVKASAKNGNYVSGTVTKGKYKLNRNNLTIIRANPKITVVEDFQFMGDSMLVVNDNDDHPLTRIDAIRFYWWIVAGSLLFGLIGLVLLIKQKKKPVKKEKGIGGSFFKLFNIGGSLNPDDVPRIKTPGGSTGSTGSMGGAQGTAGTSTTTGTAAGGGVKINMGKSTHGTSTGSLGSFGSLGSTGTSTTTGSSETLGSTGVSTTTGASGSKIISSVKSSAGATGTSFTSRSAGSASVSSSDSDLMERAGDL